MRVHDNQLLRSTTISTTLNTTSPTNADQESIMGEASCPLSNQQCVESMQTIDRHNETTNKQFDRGDSFSPLSHLEKVSYKKDSLLLYHCQNKEKMQPMMSEDSSEISFLTTHLFQISHFLQHRG